MTEAEIKRQRIQWWNTHFNFQLNCRTLFPQSFHCTHCCFQQDFDCSKVEGEMAGQLWKEWHLSDVEQVKLQLVNCKSCTCSCQLQDILVQIWNIFVKIVNCICLNSTNIFVPIAKCIWPVGRLHTQLSIISIKQGLKVRKLARLLQEVFDKNWQLYLFKLLNVFVKSQNPFSGLHTHSCQLSKRSRCENLLLGSYKKCQLKIYLLKLWNIFVQIDKCICLNAAVNYLN